MSDTDEEETQKTINITVVGEPSTGKSTLCSRYLGGGGSGGGGTQGAEVMVGQCLGLRPAVSLQLCDVAGNSLTTHMLDNYLYASDIVLFVYDLTNLASFEKLGAWLEKVRGVFEAEARQPLMALFGNKADLEHQRAVRLSTVQQFASEHLLDNFKGSARTGEAVNNAITSLVVRAKGLKVTKLPVGENRSPNAPKPNNGQLPSGLSYMKSTESLIMTRNALRKLRKKKSSIVCNIQ